MTVKLVEHLEEAAQARVSLLLSYCHIVGNQMSRLIFIGPRRDKTGLRGVANNKGAYQPTHPRRLISAFVIH